MNFKKKYLFILLGVIALVGAIAYFLYVNNNNKLINLIRPHVYIEYGNKVTINDIFVTKPEQDFQFSMPLDQINSVGDYSLSVTIEHKEINFEIHIIDSTEPVLEVKPITIYLDESFPKPVDFVIKCEDLSNCSYPSISFKREEGTQTVSIIALDDYGNKALKETTLTIVAYNDKPNITGLSDLLVKQGNKVDLRNGVVANDKRFGVLDFKVDDSQVNYDKPGVYEIIYTATDPLGNTTTKTRKITVQKKETSYMIENFPTFSQYPKYPNGCETVALYNLLRYYNVSVNIDDLMDRLTKGDGPHIENGIFYGGDPEIEFVGDPRDLHGYGVYQKPIISLANRYRSGLEDYTGHSLNDVLSLVKQGIPVQVWVSIGLKNTSVCATWTHRFTGKQIKWICNLHSVIVVGYNSTTVYVSDSYTGKIEGYNRNQFEKMYNLFGKRALYYPN